MNTGERELLWLRRVRDHSQALADETRPGVLLPLILDSAIEITGAERGYLVRVKGEKPEGGHACHVECARGFSQERLRSAAGDVSRTVVERVLESSQGLVTTREEDADVLDASSVQASRVVSIMCVPMRLRGKVRGVLYLDHRLRQSAFTEDDLPNLRTFADQAALAIETAELRAGAAPADSGLGELERLQSARESLEPRQAPLRFGKLVGNSPVMCDLYEEIERAARGHEPVLVLGEAGTGKALVASEIHARGESPRQPCIVQSCAAVSDTQVEGELFGHALQGARRGAFLRAERGTLILDDIADLSLTMQGKLVGVLRDRRLSPVGSSSRARVQCRVIAISHHDLVHRSRSGEFREDLFYRLDVQRIRVPSLRERLDDLPALVDWISDELSGRRLTITDTARTLLADFPWPGNVRQLRNEVRRLLTLDIDRISARQLSEDLRKSTGATSSEGGATSGKTLGEVEKEMLETAMRDAGGNKAKAARKLGIPRSTLYGLLERYGLKEA